MRYFITISLLLISSLCAQSTQVEPFDVSVSVFYRPNEPELPTTKRLIDLMRKDKTISIQQWGGIELPGGGAKASLMMSIAGDTAPDVGEAWFHVIGSEVRNGFLYPLNEWIGEDEDGNGMIDDHEAKWDGWKDVPTLWRKVAMHDGKIYGIPQATKSTMGVIFRTDLVKAAGLNPNNPPETWDEFRQWCDALTQKDKTGLITQRGIGLQPYGFTFLPWIQSAGGSPIVQYKTSPTSGEKIAFPADAISFKSPSGEDLSSAPSEWQANFDSPEAAQAAKLYHDLIWQKWIKHPDTGKGIYLTKEDLTKGSVEVDGKEISFTQTELYTGTAIGQTGQRGESAFDYLANGRTAMVTWFADDLNSMGQKVNISPDLLSWFPFPKGPGPNATQAIQIQNHYIVMYEGVSRRSKAERDKIWEVATALSDKEVRDNAVKQKVLSGMARFAKPSDLKRLGYDEYLAEIPQAIKNNFTKMDSGKIAAATEPYMGFWSTVDGALNREVLSLIIAQTGENFDYQTALKHVNKKANGGMMFAMTDDELNKYRPNARIVFAIIVIIMICLMIKIVRNSLKKDNSNLAKKAGSRNVYNKYLAWGMVAPALILIALWSYYPSSKV
ncbi:extracellular solute-binding protein [Lentisphaera profundi]|uniref:Extracellular solute-binding protein n=1 Tax=Lentisphaera profundi TaxID=1658616 RepID=A0ABY7VNH1_9BACT|nr:extracellular solute-binding protein [Lentisphaera profundi]WDE95296.1 extracellular solute-binding protein [Lentisphaera profundi]